MPDIGTLNELQAKHTSGVNSCEGLEPFRDSLADIYSSYVKACEAGEIVDPMIKSLYRAHKYLRVEQLYHDKPPQTGSLPLL
jgi:hypothetical protein